MRPTPPRERTMAEPALLEAAGLRLSLPDYSRKPPFGAAPTVDILHGIDLALAPGDTLGIVGESGSGKTSLGRTLVRLYKPTAGRILFDGQDISGLPEDRLRPLRARVQMIFQDPQSSLNPRRRVADIVAQPLWLHGRAATKAGARRPVEALPAGARPRPAPRRRPPPPRRHRPRYRIAAEPCRRRRDRLRPRRVEPGADPRPAARVAAGHGPRPALYRPRPFRRAHGVRPGYGDAERPGGRTGRLRCDLRGAETSLYPPALERDPAARCRPGLGRPDGGERTGRDTDHGCERQRGARHRRQPRSRRSLRAGVAGPGRGEGLRRDARHRRLRGAGRPGDGDRARCDRPRTGRASGGGMRRCHPAGQQCRREPQPADLGRYGATKRPRGDGGQLLRHHGDVPAVRPGARRQRTAPRRTTTPPPPGEAPADVANAALDAVEAGEEDIYPGVVADGVSEGLAADPKGVEKQFAEYLPG